MLISQNIGGSFNAVSLTDLIAGISGRITLVGGPAPIRGQRILFGGLGLFSGEEQVVLFVSPAAPAGSWPCIVAWRGQVSQAWTEQVQGSPYRDTRTQAQKDADEVVRLAALAKAPFGGSYALGPLSPFGYPSVANYIEPYFPTP